MAKLSDLFGRKGGEAGPDTLSQIGVKPGNGHRTRGEPISLENYSDVGSRMGEENEVLRNLLTDTGRKIGELDDLKAAFDKLVAPFNSTLRALEQEKSQTLSLSGMLAEARTAYENLRTDFYQVDRKATALEAEVEKLREDLELSREANCGLESARLELTDDLNVSTRCVRTLPSLTGSFLMKPRSGARWVKRGALCRTSSMPPKSASCSWKVSWRPRARS